MLYNARDLAAMPAVQLWALPDGPIKVVFDDGVLETNARATIYSAYMWRMYTRYPKTPALVAHHLGDRRIGSDTHLDLLGKVMWDCYDAYNGEVAVETLSKLVYEDTNRIYNDFTYGLESYVRTLSILDFMEVINHPEIKTANEQVQPNQLSIDHCYKKIKEVLRDPKELIGNPVANAAKSGLVSIGQIQQCVGPRGFVTDVDSNIFRKPILTGYVHGIRSLVGSMTESRSASKSLSFTEDPLQKTEYFNRRLQLMADTVKYIVPGDCGSDIYVDWRVGPGDLDRIAGKMYLDASGKLQRVKETDRHLVGEWIKMRTVFYCKHHDTNSVCQTCFGDLALSIPDRTIIGHVSATALCEQASQRVLSVKHEDGSSTVDSIELSDYYQQFIRVGTDPNSIKLSERLEHKRVILTINGKEAQHLSDVKFVNDVRDLPVATISELTEVSLTIVSKSREETVVVPVAVGSRHSSMTHELLDYAKQHGWATTASGNYAIDLAHWDMELPLFQLPMRHMNMLDYMNTIETFIKASTVEGAQRTLRDFPTPEAALREFYALVSSHLFVNIAHLEILIKAAMIRSREDRDYRIPHVGNRVEFGRFLSIMGSRSLSAGMAFERQRSVINEPATYLIKNRPDHILDPLLLPPAERGKVL